jgi:subtilisin-like proprotein convertase family protein
LAALRDRPITGNWTLQVLDLAAQDTGRLTSWGIDLTVSATPLTAEDATSVRIPDNDRNGIVRSLTLPAGRVIEEASISVDITHPWVGDLRIALVPPGGQPIVLRDQVGGSADNIDQTWRSRDSAALQPLRGRDAGGVWQLQVADLASRDEGKLNRWRIEIA